MPVLSIRTVLNTFDLVCAPRNSFSKIFTSFYCCILRLYHHLRFIVSSRWKECFPREIAYQKSQNHWRAPRDARNKLFPKRWNHRFLGSIATLLPKPFLDLLTQPLDEALSSFPTRSWPLHSHPRSCLPRSHLCLLWSCSSLELKLCQLAFSCWHAPWPVRTTRQRRVQRKREVSTPS